MKSANPYIIPIICILYISAFFTAPPLGLAEAVYGTALCTATACLPPEIPAGPPYVIAIDPGHGGMDTGAIAKIKEIQLIDTTSAYLWQLLEDDPDFIPVYTRTDTDPESDERAQIANSNGAALLISIHANSDSHSSSKGFECFPTPPGRTHHSNSLQFARLIVEQMRNAGHTIRGGEEKTGIRYAYYYGKEKRIVDSSDNKVRSRKSFGILEKVTCPRVLVEQCFITNHNDVQNWATDTGCRHAAQLYYTAIKQYFEEK